MPVLFNKESGLAEDLPQEVANSALASGTHEIPVISPKGEQGSVAPEAVSELVQQGYRQPKTEELKDMLSTAAHTGVEQQITAGVEGLGRGVLGPASDVILKATGVDPEDIRKREEVYPATHAIAEGAGLIGGTLGGKGLGALISKAGQVAQVSKDAAFIAKAASAIGQGAIEGALFQASNETSKMIQQDPAQTSDTAIANIRMAALLGGAISGTVSGTSALWDATRASKAGQFIADAKGMAKQHLGIKSEPQFSENPTSPFYRGDALQGEGLAYPESDYSKTAGGKMVNALIRNGLVEQASGAVGAAVGSAAHHPIIGYLFGKNTIAPMIEKALPAIIRPLLETEGSAAGLKAAVGYTMNAIKGENLLNKAAASVFGEAQQESDTTSYKEREKLKEHLETLQNEPQHLFNVGKDLGHYMPDHAQALAQTTANTVQYLQSLKPHTAGQAPLDEERKLSPIEEAIYNRALDIAQNPLIITNAIKNGTLTTNDIGHIKTMYPSLYSALNQKITSQLIDKKTDKSAIPYHTKLAISAFMGQPLDSSMLPNAIMASQGQGQTQQAMQQPKIGTAPKNMNKLDKISDQSNTMTGSREQYRSSRH